MPGSDRIVVYTDGACLGNPGPGGWAWVVPDGGYAAGASARTTNQRMEVQAVLEALRALPGPIDVVSDSTYVVNCFRDRWWEGWLRRGWVNSKKQPVANRDLWEPLIELYRSRSDVDFRWVKGHSGDRWNDAADDLASTAAASQQGRSGSRYGYETVDEIQDDDAGAGTERDTPRARQPGSSDRPVGRTLAVVGPHAKDLGGGYDDDDTPRKVRDRLVEIMRAKRELHPDLVVVTGLGLGVEQIAAEAAIRAGVPHVAVLPFPGVDGRWPHAGRTRFQRLVESAAEVRMLRPVAPKDRQEAGRALGSRDATIDRWADEAIVVRPSGSSNDRRSRALEKAVGEDEVWFVDLDG